MDFQSNQTWLHQKLKNLYLMKVGGTEETVLHANGRKYRVDILNEEHRTAFEIHRSNFGGRFSEKIKQLIQLTDLKIVIVHPIVVNQKVTRMTQGKTIGISHYNKGGDIYTLFEKLVFFKLKFIPQRMDFDILFIKEHVLKESIGFWRSSMRRRYKIVQRDLLSVHKTKKFLSKKDFIHILPKGLPDTFTNRDIASGLEIQGGLRRIRRISGCLTYSLCRLGILRRVGSRGRAHEFSIQV